VQSGASSGLADLCDSIALPNRGNKLNHWSFPKSLERLSIPGVTTMDDDGWLVSLSPTPESCADTLGSVAYPTLTAQLDQPRTHFGNHSVSMASSSTVQSSGSSSVSFANNRVTRHSMMANRLT
jgi:hypothetical protein